MQDATLKYVIHLMERKNEIEERLFLLGKDILINTKWTVVLWSIKTVTQISSGLIHLISNIATFTVSMRCAAFH